MKDVAVCTYLDNNDRHIKEFNWLYRSWNLSGSWMSSDLVVFHHPGVTIHNKDVITIPLVPLTASDPKWSDYPFINSVYFLTALEAEFLKRYKYVMRTDHDVFLTPNFPKLRPRLATFGLGMYSQSIEAVNKLNSVAERWGVVPTFNNVGSTLIAYSNIVIQYCKLHLEYCNRLLKEEFSNFTGTWPGWFKGVLSMYAGNLAANAFFGTGLTFGGLDVHCMSHDKMCNTDYHIHAWHTTEDFSKFKWHNGEYSHLDSDALNKTIISNYCHFIAGHSQ